MFENGPLPPDTTLNYSYQLFEALDYLHQELRVIHCDIKREEETGQREGREGARKERRRKGGSEKEGRERRREGAGEEGREGERDEGRERKRGGER